MAKNILIVHGSPRKGGNSDMLADEFERGAQEAGNTVVRIDAGRAKIAGCIACEYCFTHDGECCQKDEMQEFYPLLREADLLVYATPVYYFNFPAQLRAFQDRMFCGIAKPFGIKETALLLCFEDKNASIADSLLDLFKVSSDYCKQAIIGEVVVSGVYEKGAIVGNDGLRQAYELGKSIS